MSTAQNIRAFLQSDAGMHALVAYVAPPGSAVTRFSSTDTWEINPGPPPFDQGRVYFRRGGDYAYQPWSEQ